MSNNVLSLESNKYNLKLSNFEGPLDLLCYLIDKEKMDIYEVSIDDITDQYIKYLETQENLNLEIASEFLVMASNLLLIKSKGLLPKEIEDEAELTEDELIKRIIEYKKYKEICKTLQNQFNMYSKRIYKSPEIIELPKQNLEINYNKKNIVNSYKNLIAKNQNKKNEYASNIEKIAILDNYTVYDKVKEIYKELLKKPVFIFGKKFSLKEKSKEEVVTAFTSILELSKRNKILAYQEKLFGDITISKRKRI